MNNNYLKIGEKTFELNLDKSYLEICIQNEKIIECSVYCKFNENEFNENSVEPHIEINHILLSKNKMEELVGNLFEINDVNESFARGDSFYLFESEPFINYKIEVLEINGDKAHVLINGVGITDGYSKPYKTENFIADVYISIKIINRDLIHKENNIVKKNETKEKKINLQELLYALLFGVVGFLLLFEFLKTNNYIYFIIFIPMILIASLFIYEIFNKINHSKKVKRCLSRRNLIDILKKDDNDYNKLSLIKRELNKYKYYNDSRFMPKILNENKWRHIFLRDEALEHIKKGDISFAYMNLFELIEGINPVLHGSNILQMHFEKNNSKAMHEKYYSDGFICKQEKDIIMEIINAIESNIQH